MFWLKQNSYNKGAGDDEHRDRFVYAGGKLEKLPICSTIVEAIGSNESPLVARLTAYSGQCLNAGQRLAALGFEKVIESVGEAYHAWNSSLPGWVDPASECQPAFDDSTQLRERLSAVIARREQLRAEMIARQEEMDWLVYTTYGLIAEADVGPELQEADLTLAREQRPFCLWAEADQDFDKAVALIPAGWSKAKKELWQKRLGLIRDNEHVCRIEQPVYKRRWDEQWKIGNRWECGPPAYDQEFLDAFHWWLSEKAEWWLEQQKKPVELAAWQAALWSDERVQAAWPVAAEAEWRLARWRQAKWKAAGQAPSSEPDVGEAAFAKVFRDMVKEQTVPEDIPFAVPWAELEKKRKIPATVKKIRGKLNVPRERFWTTADGKYRVARPME